MAPTEVVGAKTVGIWVHLKAWPHGVLFEYGGNCLDQRLRELLGSETGATQLDFRACFSLLAAAGQQNSHVGRRGTAAQIPS